MNVNTINIILRMYMTIGKQVLFRMLSHSTLLLHHTCGSYDKNTNHTAEKYVL